MKLNAMKKAVLATAIIVIGTAGAFAQKPEKKGCPRPDFRPGHHAPFNFGEKQVMGTISSVNIDAETITLTDADGKTRKIHINPLTNICKIEPNKFPPKSKKGDKKEMREPPFHIFKLNIENLSTGQWVTVQKFNTDTETIEAQNITVHKGDIASPNYNPDAK